MLALNSDAVSRADTHGNKKAADKIAADMALMRELLLDAIGPDLPSTPSGVTLDLERDAGLGVGLGGAPRLSTDVMTLLSDVEAMGPAAGLEDLATIVEKVQVMSPQTLLSSAQFFGELMCHANLAGLQQSVRSWKANLRADAGFVVDRTAAAVVGIPTFKGCFDGLLAKGI